MKGKQVFFYALKEDLKELLEFLELDFDIQYAEAGLLDEKVSLIFSLIPKVESNYLEYGNWNFSKRYLILPKGLSLNIREIPQLKGGLKFAVDQMKNQNSIILSLGGIYDNAIIASEISTNSNSEFSKEIIKSSIIFFKKYKKIKGFYVSPNTLNKAKSGYRLTTDINSPVEYDLDIS